MAARNISRGPDRAFCILQDLGCSEPTSMLLDGPSACVGIMIRSTASEICSFDS